MIQAGHTRSKRVVIVGGGLAGLAAAYDLSRTGFHVVVLEAAPDFGGLASSFRLEGHPVERFYHFICGSDRSLVQLVSEVGLESKLHWRHTTTGFTTTVVTIRSARRRACSS